MGENTTTTTTSNATAENTPMRMARTTSALLREAERNAEEQTVASPREYHDEKKTKGKAAAVAGHEEAGLVCRNGIDQEEMECTQHVSVDKGRRSSACGNEDVRSAWTQDARRETGEGSEYEVKTRRNEKEEEKDKRRESEEEVRSARKVKRRRRSLDALDTNHTNENEIVHAEEILRRNSSTAAPALPGKKDLLASLPDEVRYTRTLHARTRTRTRTRSITVRVDFQAASSARCTQCTDGMWMDMNVCLHTKTRTYIQTQLQECILELVDPRDLVHLRCVSKWLSQSKALWIATTMKMKAYVDELTFSSQASNNKVTRDLGFRKCKSRAESPLMVLEFMHRMRKARLVSECVGLGSYHSALIMRGSSSSDDSCDTTADVCASLHMSGRGFHGQLGLGDHCDKSEPTPLHDHIHIKDLTRSRAAHETTDSGDETSIDEVGADEIHESPEDETGKFSGLYVKAVAENHQYIETSDHIVQVSCGGCHTAAVTAKGKLLTWGLASSGELGHGGCTPIECPSPRLVRSVNFLEVVRVAAGGNHTIAVTRCGSTWTCGRGRHGQLGHGHYHDVGPLQKVSALNGRTIVGVAAGATHSAAYAADGALYTWGSNSCGQLGHGVGHVVGFPWPRRVSEIAREHIFSVAAGGQHTLAVTSAGVMYAFGRNRHGALGLGDATNRYTPERVRVVPEWAEGEDDENVDERIAAVAAGADHSIVLTGLGKVYTCGHCNYGQLGHGDLVSTTVFTEVWALSNTIGRGNFITAVAAGDHHSAAVDSKGCVWMWGRGEWGQLGFGATRSQWKPVRIMKGSVPIDDLPSEGVCAGSRHSMASMRAQ